MTQQDKLRAKTSFLTQRAQIIRLVRRWFDEQNFLEVQTPFVVAKTSFDPNLFPAEVGFEDHRGKHQKAFLRMSPELSLKKLLASGHPKIYEIAPCFRSRENTKSPHHNAEFTLLECYRANADYKRMMSDVADLLRFLVRGLFDGKTTFSHDGHVYSVGDIPKKSMNDLFEQHADCPLSSLEQWEELIPIAHKKGFLSAKTLGEAFYLIFLNEVEPKLNPSTPTIVYDYPGFESAFAKTFKQEGKHYAERFELYFGGLELANACSELINAEEQRQRMESVRQKFPERKRHLPHYSLDEEFLNALKTMKTSAGVALGLDRLVMLLTGAKTIDEVAFGPKTSEERL